MLFIKKTCLDLCYIFFYATGCSTRELYCVVREGPSQAHNQLPVDPTKAIHLHPSVD